MFHSNMADFYAFLHLDLLREFHDEQYLEEAKIYRKIKNHYIKNYDSTLIIDHVEPIENITPKEWCTKTSRDIDEASLKILLK